MASIFTRIVNGEIPCYRIAENEHFLAFLDVFPLVKGHTLIVPKQEIDYIFDIEDAMLSDMMIFAKRVAKAVHTAMPCQRVGMSVIGLEVPHAHIHLVPMQTANDLNFTRSKIQVEKSEMEDIAARIIAHLD